jgi:hypothetical protein
VGKAHKARSVVDMEAKSMRLLLNNSEFIKVLLRSKGWILITKGMRIPKIVFPFTRQTCKYKTKIA